MVAKSFKNRVLAFICTVIFVITTHGNAFSQTSKDYWSEFRHQYPFHFQTLLISDPNAKGERTLIIAEPPPGFRLPDAEKVLKESFGQTYAGVKARQHPIGFNGWVRDYVVTLAPPVGATQETSDRQITDGIAALSYSLYGTTYKAHALQLPVKQSQKVYEAPPNLSITPGELKSWIVDSKREFVSVDTSEAVSLETILKNNLTGVFLSKEQGLSLLVLSRSDDLNNHWADLRKFALDSDLILGAVVRENEDELVIVGRDRQTSLSAMPPLRAETILTLAAAADEELYQSFERQHVFAGKIDKGELQDKDWAPILLSENLINTELGSLLNITDQILKSWSMAGDVEYANFSYPKPQIFPFNSQRLIDQIGATQVLFNWNTTGLGAVYDFGDYEIFTATKTGALPLTYGSDLEEQGVITTGDFTEFEDEAYDYFSQQRNVHLTQVAQYTALYQIFRQFPINKVSWKNQVNQQDIERIRDELKSQVIEALQRIETGDANLVTQSEEELRQLLDEIRSTGLEAEAQEELEAFGNEILANLAKLKLRLAAASEALRDLKEEFGPDIIEKFATYLAEPRRLQLSPEARERLRQITTNPEIDNEEFLNQVFKDPDLAEIGLSSLVQIRFGSLVKLTTNSNEVLKHIVDASKYEPASNIKTPTVVVSRDTQNRWAIGGHNLDSKVTKVVVDSSQSRGNVGINRLPNDTVELRIHPDDAINNPSLARFYSRNFAGQTQFNIPPASKIPPRLSDAALKSGDNTPESPSIAAIGDVGFGTISPPSTNNLRQIAAFIKEQDIDFYADQLSDGSFLIGRRDTPNFLYAKSTPALTEILNSNAWTRKSGKLYFQNIPEGSVEGIKQSLQVRQAAAGNGSIPPKLPPVRQTLFSDPPNRGWLFSLVPQDDGKVEVLAVSRRQEKPESTPGVVPPIFKPLLQVKPDWSRAEIKNFDIPPRPESTSTEFGKGYQFMLPVSQQSSVSQQPFALDMIIHAFLGNPWTSKEVNLGETAIQQAFNTSKLNDATLEQGIINLKKELTDRLEPLDLEFFTTGIEDLHIIRRKDAQNEAL